MNKEYNGEINAISSSELMKDTDLMNKMMSLVTRVYDADDAELFYQEIAESPDIVIVYMTLDDVVIGIGCICESHISYGVYELFWGMLDAEYRGNGWGKVLVESRLEWVAKHNKGLSSPNDVIVVTKSPWHLTRCGFEILKQLNSEGEVLMYRKLSKTELKLQDIKTIETIKTLGNYSEKEKVKYEFDKTRNFYNSILDMVHKFRIKNNI